MAELSATRATPEEESNGHDSTTVPGATIPVSNPAAEIVDPRAVRVRLAAVSRPAAEPVMRVSPPPVEPPGDGSVRAHGHPVVDGESARASIRPTGRGRHILDEAGRRSRVVIEEARPGEAGSTVREVLVDGFRFEVEVESERIAALRERAGRGRTASAHSGPLEVKAIIPGKVVEVSVATGDAVTAGQHLLVVEAMKMQNELRAPRDGTIERVGVAPGVNIEVGDLLLVIS
jgi:biotin carboxyl carrier protein